MEMMDALVKAAPEKGLVLTQVPKPVPGMGEVLIKIHKTAICGTDVHIYNWDPWAQLRMPRRPRVRQQAANRLPAYVSLSNGLTSIVLPS